MTGLQNSRNPALADFDWRSFAQKIRLKAHEGGRAQAVIAAEIGITVTDLSRVRGGQMVSVAKAIALARWLGPSLNAWYLPPMPFPVSGPGAKQAKTTPCTGSNVKHAEAAE